MPGSRASRWHLSSSLTLLPRARGSAGHVVVDAGKPALTAAAGPFAAGPHGRKPAFDHRQHPGQRIAQNANLLAFVKATGAVGHRYFHRAETRSNQFTEQLEIEIKTIAG